MNEPEDVAAAAQMEPTKALIIESSNAGRLPYLRQLAATNTPMAPVAQRQYPANRDTSGKVIWNSVASTPAIGARIGPNL